MNVVREAMVRESVVLSEEDRSKDEFFVKLAHVAEAMIAAHDKDFAMGALVLTARFIAEGKPLTKPGNSVNDRMNPAT
jgi:predicted nuclease of predicted toxin-antitoxin system